MKENQKRESKIHYQLNRAKENKMKNRMKLSQIINKKVLIRRRFKGEKANKREINKGAKYLSTESEKGCWKRIKWAKVC